MFRNPKDVLGLWQIDLANQDPDFDKPIVMFLNGDCNVFAMAGQVKAALRDIGRTDLGNEAWQRLARCKSYEEAVRLFREYVIVADDYLVPALKPVGG